MFIRFVGLDVHKDSIKIAVAEEGRDKARFLASIPNDSEKVASDSRGVLVLYRQSKAI